MAGTRASWSWGSTTGSPRRRTGSASWPTGGGRVDLYGATGNLLRRYDLGGTLPLIAYWAPDSRHAAIYTRTGGTAASEEGDFGTWLLDERGRA